MAVIAVRAGVAVAMLDIAGNLAEVVVGHVTVVAAGESAGPGRAGVVCSQDTQAAEIFGLHQPDKAVAEHGLGSLEKLGAQLVQAEVIFLEVVVHQNARLPWLHAGRDV